MIPSSGSLPGAVLRGLLLFGVAWTGLKACACSAGAQEVRESLAGEKSAEAAKTQEYLQGYDLHYGPVSLQVEFSLQAEYTDNALNSALDRRADEIITPELDVRSHWPITELNALTFSLGLNYPYYLHNTQLNPDSPLISPGSELALVLYVKNFRFRFHERFSYQESLNYGVAYSQQTGQFINLVNLGAFGRIDNLVGFIADWDLNTIVLSAAYDHENFISTASALDYLTRASELASLEAAAVLGPTFRSGLESKASWNAYDTHQLPDHWRARVGPFVAIQPGEHVSLRAGGGYEDVLTPRTGGLATDYTPYYAYARVTHTVNDWLSYSLNAAHENQLGWFVANLETTYVGLFAKLRFIDRVELSPAFSYGLGKEYGPSYTGQFYHENYNYFDASLGLAYHFAERWVADLRYEYLEKDSDLLDFGYYRNRITGAIIYRF
jgi:hypothetical protein